MVFTVVNTTGPENGDIEVGNHMKLCVLVFPDPSGVAQIAQQPPSKQFLGGWKLLFV